jgi:hypothetical protein
VDDEALRRLGHDLVALARVLAAELGIELAAEQAGHHCRVLHEVGLIAVDIRQPFAEVAVEPLGGPMRAAHVLDELVGARAHYLGIGKLRVLLELGGAVDAVEGRCQQGHERGIYRLQPENDGYGIGRLDGGDIGEPLLAHGDHALGRGNDALEGSLDVG